jgi:aryl-alcohol dehydrogenase-like predicted oxidoreductase
MNFGPKTTEKDSFAIMDTALDAGINFFDTANVYGWKRGEGITEQIVGRWFAQGGGRREKVIIATKVYGTMGKGPNEGHTLSAYHIRRHAEESLRRLQTDHIDLYQMHHIDRTTSWDEIWQAMELLVQQGKVIYVGSSNFAGWHIAQAQEAAKARNFLGLVSEQSLYNLSERKIELEVIPACIEYGLGLIPYSPLAAGAFAGAFEKPAGSRRDDEELQEQIKEHEKAFKDYETFCKDLGASPATVALAWLLHQPAVTAPIIGPRTMRQLTDAVKSLDFKLDEAAMARLDEIWPGPGGAAPEAYAW